MHHYLYSCILQHSPSHKLEDLEEQLATSAQAATVATTSNTIDPAKTTPAVDEQSFSDDAGDGVIDGMCFASAVYGDGANSDDDVPEGDSDDDVPEGSTSPSESDDADPNGNRSD